MNTLFDIDDLLPKLAEQPASTQPPKEADEYLAFLKKFEAKKTTDDCYTPPIVYNAVADWVASEYGLDKSKFVRPFYPNGDYKKEYYAPDCVVVDNPPFSLLAEITRFYLSYGIRFFLFAPHLTLFSASSSLCSQIPVGVSITYENGASVATSFITNLEPDDVQLRSCPELYEIVKKANDINKKEVTVELPKYNYPDNVVMAYDVAKLSKYGQHFVLRKSECVFIRQLDAQKATQKGLFGSGFLCSEKAAAEKANVVTFELSEREKAIIKRLGENETTL